MIKLYLRGWEQRDPDQDPEFYSQSLSRDANSCGTSYSPWRNPESCPERCFSPPTDSQGFGSWSSHPAPLSDCYPVLRVRSHPASCSRGMREISCEIQKSRRFWRYCSRRRSMMSAIETGVYQPAQLLSWVYMSLQDAPGSAFDGSKVDSDTSQDVNKSSAADLSSNYLNNFFHQNSEVELMWCCAVTAHCMTVYQSTIPTYWNNFHLFAAHKKQSKTSHEYYNLLWVISVAHTVNPHACLHWVAGWWVCMNMRFVSWYSAWVCPACSGVCEQLGDEE